MRKLMLAVSCLMLALGGRAFAADDAQAMLDQIEKIKPTQFDASKRGDEAYMREYMEEQKKLMAQRAELDKKFHDAYPSHEKAPKVMAERWQILMQLGRADEVAAETDVIIKEKPDSDLAKMARQMSQAVAGQMKMKNAVGKPFELTFTDAISGKTIDMKDLKGKVVVVDFWATWCGPCVAEMPKMKELYQQYKPKGVEFIGVSLDQSEDKGGLSKLREFVKTNEITWPQYYQGKYWQSEFSSSWGIDSIPRVFVIDTAGNLASTEGRGQLETLIPNLLNKEKTAANPKD